MVKKLLLTFLLVTALFADSGTSLRTHGQATLPEGFGAVPGSPTILTSKSCVVFQITVSNTTGGALTFTVSDRQASPQTPIDAVSIPANTILIMTFPEGARFKGGITWSAGSTGLIAETFGFTDND